jgi:hypothetical protein
MTATLLLKQALGLLISDPIKTLLVICPALLLMIAVCGAMIAATPELLTLGAGTGLPADIALSWMSVFLLITFVFSYALMAILWHRHTLGDTHTSLPLSAHLIIGYLGRVLMLALIQLAVSLAFIIPLILSHQNAQDIPQSPSVVSILITTFASQLMLVWLSLRLSLILPAAAIGRPIRMTHSWRITHALAGPLWGVAAVLALLNTGMTAAVTFLGLSTPAYAMLVEVPMYILEGLLIFSILTTLYSRQIKHSPPSPL